MTTEPLVTCLAVTGIGEVGPGDDLADLLTDAVVLRDGDILVVTSKVVSKAEGRVATMEKSVALTQETDRVVATRGGTSIVRTHHGLVMAAAGIDSSNTEPGTIVLLPRDPDASARALREHINVRTGANVAVVVTDTSGRAWRTGQTDIAIGAAGIEPARDYSGRTDDYGNPLAVTAPAVADEIAGAADLVKGKLDRVPAAVLRGLAELVLEPGSHGPGATVLARGEAGDMFGYGTREAVLHAVTRDGRRGFGAPASAETLADALRGLVGGSSVVVRSDQEVTVLLESVAGATGQRVLGNVEARFVTVAFAFGWTETSGQQPLDPSVTLRFRTATP